MRYQQRGYQPQGVSDRDMMMLMMMMNQQNQQKQQAAQQQGGGNSGMNKGANTLGTAAGGYLAKQLGTTAGTSALASGGSGIGATTGAGFGSGSIATGGAIPAAGTGTTGAATAGTATSTGGTAAGSSTMGAVGTAAWIAAALYAAYQGYNNYKDAKKNAKGGSLTDKEIQSVIHPDLMGEQKIFGDKGGALKYSPLSLAAKALIGSGKDEDQLWRDRVRRGLAEKKFTEMKDDSHHVKLADGTLFNIGKDGINAGEMGKAYNVDLNDEESRRVAGLMAPLATALVGGSSNDRSEKLVRDLTGYLTNAAVSNGKADENIRALYAKAGLGDKDSAFNMMTAMREAGGIKDQANHEKLNDALNQIYDPNYNQQAKQWFKQSPEVPGYAKPKEQPQQEKKVFSPEEEQAMKAAATMTQQPAWNANAIPKPTGVQPTPQTQGPITGGIPKPTGIQPNPQPQQQQLPQGQPQRAIWQLTPEQQKQAAQMMQGIQKPQTQQPNIEQMIAQNEMVYY